MNSSIRDFKKKKGGKAHCFFFYSVSNALNDILNNGDVVTVGFVTAKPHHSPSQQHRIPMDFDNAIINLFSGSLEPIQKARQRRR